MMMFVSMLTIIIAPCDGKKLYFELISGINCVNNNDVITTINYKSKCL